MIPAETKPKREWLVVLGDKQCFWGLEGCELWLVEAGSTSEAESAQELKPVEVLNLKSLLNLTEPARTPVKNRKKRGR